MTDNNAAGKPELWKRFVVGTIGTLLIVWLGLMHFGAFYAFVIMSHDGVALDAAMNARDWSFMDDKLKTAESEEERAALMQDAQSKDLFFGASLFCVPSLILWELWAFTRKRLLRQSGNLGFLRQIFMRNTNDP
jgi:hypothetical protein